MHLQTLQRSVLVGCTALLCACVDLRTTVPDVDLEPPEVELRLLGPGIGEQVLSNPPRETWTGVGGVQYLDLVPGASYRFTLLVRDAGGVARAAFSLPEELELTDLVGDGLRNEIVGISRRLTVYGSRTAPYRVLSVSGRLHVPDAASSFDLGCEGDDFGGVAGTPNQRLLFVSTAYGL